MGRLGPVMRALGGVALLLAIVLLVVDNLQLRGLHHRVAELELALSVTAPAPVAPAGRGAARPTAPPPDRRQAFDDARKERIRAVLREEGERRAAEKTVQQEETRGANLDALAAELDLDRDTTEALGEELAARAETVRGVRQDLRDGALTVIEAREELAIQKQASDEAIRDLLGPERFAKLQELFPRAAGSFEPE